MRRVFILLVSCIPVITWGQDPVSTQFFNAPLLNNPALSAYGDNSMHIYANYRQQWVGASSSYNTMLASITGKILRDKFSKSDALGAGAMFMSDVSLDGAFKSTYASFNLAYLLSLNESGTTRVGIGLAGLYGSRRVDFSNLTFSSQFSSHGFNTTLPTGESAIGAMHDYFSMSAGMLFTHREENTNIVLGAAGYHFNTPSQTSVPDVYDQLPTRFVVHGGVERFLNTQLSMELTALLQSQASNNYFMSGVIGKYYPQGEDGAISVSTGLFYRNTKTISPYIGITRKSLQFGLTYDINMSSNGMYSNAMKAWELGLSVGIK